MQAKHLAFVDEYFLNSLNATEAYKKVYGVKDDNAAAASASRLLRNVKSVTLEIERRFNERAMKANEVIDRLSQIARGDVADFLDIGTMGFSVDLHKAYQAKKTHLVKKVKQKTTTVIGKGDMPDQEFHETEFELYSAHEALRDLAKVHALFIDRTRLEGDPLSILQALKAENKITEADIPTLLPDFGETLIKQLFGEQALVSYL